MSLTGNSSLSLKRKDVKEQKSLAVGFKKLVFAHKASLGDTAINLAALTAPTEMMALGFSNPTSGELAAAQLLFYKTNLTLVSSARGVLMQDLSYSVQTSTRIVFNGFTALEGEIFTGVIDYNARNGINVVDAAPIVATGTLAVGAVDFNVGTPFEVGKYSDISQVGQVVVYRNGKQQFRNTGNSSSVLDGNYYEVDAGSGMGVLIRFNTTPVVQSDNILVFSHGLLAYRPDSSALAVIENLAGQLDQVIPTVAALSGQPETNFRAAPNNVDLKAFGDRVLSAESRLTVLETELDFLSTTITFFANSAGGYTSGSAAAQSGNSLTLTPGIWEIEGYGIKTSSATENASVYSIAIFDTNGDNLTNINAKSDKTVPYKGANLITTCARAGGSGNEFGNIIPTTKFLLNVSGSKTIFLVMATIFSVAGGGGMTGYLSARRIK